MHGMNRCEKVKRRTLGSAASFQAGKISGTAAASAGSRSPASFAFRTSAEHSSHDARCLSNLSALRASSSLMRYARKRVHSDVEISIRTSVYPPYSRFEARQTKKAGNSRLVRTSTVLCSRGHRRGRLSRRVPAGLAPRAIALMSLESLLPFLAEPSSLVLPVEPAYLRVGAVLVRHHPPAHDMGSLHECLLGRAYRRPKARSTGYYASAKSVVVYFI